MAFWPLWEVGLTNVDVFSGLTMSQASGAVMIPAPGQVGPGLKCAATSAGSQANWPATYQIIFPITQIVAFTVLGAETGAATLFGISTTAMMYINPAGTVNAFINGSGVSSFSTTIATGGTYVIAWEALPTTNHFYNNGNLTATGGGIATPSYSSPNVFFGDSTSFSGRLTNVVYHWGGIWKGSFTAKQHNLIGSNVNNIWQMFQGSKFPAFEQSVAVSDGFVYPTFVTQEFPLMWQEQ